MAVAFACDTPLYANVAAVQASPVSTAAPAGLPHLPYDEAIAHLRAGNLDFDMAGLRSDYAEQPDFRDERWPEHAAATRAVAEGRWADGVALATRRLADRPLEIDAWLLRADAERGAGDGAAADRDRAVGRAMIHAIGASGDGLGPTTAWHVIGTADEYAMLAAKGLAPGTQLLVETDGHVYDRLDVTGPGNTHGQRWFEIDRVLRRGP